MIIVIGKENQIEKDSYFVTIEDNEVVSKVFVSSALNCTAYKAKLKACLDSKGITQFYYDKLIESLHNGVKKPEYCIIDIDIDNAKLNTVDLYECLIECAIDPPFLITDSVNVAIQNTIDIGYYFNRLTIYNQFDNEG